MINAQKEWTIKATDEFQRRAQRGKSHWLYIETKSYSGAIFDGCFCAVHLCGYCIYFLFGASSTWLLQYQLSSYSGLPWSISNLFIVMFKYLSTFWTIPLSAGPHYVRHLHNSVKLVTMMCNLTPCKYNLLCWPWVPCDHQSSLKILIHVGHFERITNLIDRSKQTVFLFSQTLGHLSCLSTRLLMLQWYHITSLGEMEEEVKATENLSPNSGSCDSWE